jgi:WD40 repeat protein
LETKTELCDASTGRVLWEITADTRWSGIPRRQALAFSRDGKRLATMDAWDNPATVQVWDIDSRKKLFDLEKAGEHVAYSPDGRWIATMGRHDGIIHFWNAATGKRAFSCICSKKYDDGAFLQYGTILAFTPDSKLLVVGSGPVLEVQEDSCKEIHTLPFSQPFPQAQRPGGRLWPARRLPGNEP